MRFVTASGVLTAVVLGSVAGCTINNTVNPSDGGTQTGDSGSPDSGSTSPLGFVPSNISLGGIDLSTIVDEDIATECDPTGGTTVVVAVAAVRFSSKPRSSRSRESSPPMAAVVEA